MMSVVSPSNMGAKRGGAIKRSELVHAMNEKRIEFHASIIIPRSTPAAQINNRSGRVIGTLSPHTPSRRTRPRCYDVWAPLQNGPGVKIFFVEKKRLNFFRKI